jgi:transposase
MAVADHQTPASLVALVGELGDVGIDLGLLGFVDLAGGQGLLGQVEGRTKASVVDWLDDRGTEWKNAVKVVAIDMCSVFKSAIREVLPHAITVADHFHVVQLANKTVTEVRRRLTLQVRGRRGR